VGNDCACGAGVFGALLKGTMMRIHYRNGQDIGMVACGCDGFRPSMVNGVLCHETGCPEAWKDQERECRWCGRLFYSFHPYDGGQQFCSIECEEAYSS
jgi:hypothetical protein